MTTLVCWRCGASLETIALPLERLAQCRACGADLHVCCQCTYYNPRLSDKCDHDMAEPARAVDVANFCDYFIPCRVSQDDNAKQRTNDALDQLKTLFGEEDPAENQSAENPDATDTAQDKQQTDRERFESLFKKD